MRSLQGPGRSTNNPYALEGKKSREGVGRDGTYGDIAEEKTLESRQETNPGNV